MKGLVDCGSCRFYRQVQSTLIGVCGCEKKRTNGMEQGGQNKMRRRILTFILCICMFFQLIPAVGTVYAAGGYNPKRNDDFVIPAALRSNRDFMMGSTLRGSQANFINKMGLNGNSTYKDFETDNRVDLSEVSKELQSAGQLDYTIGARLKASHNDLNGAEVETVLKFKRLLLLSAMAHGRV